MERIRTLQFMPATADPVASAEAQHQELVVPVEPEAMAVPDTTARLTAVRMERTAAMADPVVAVATRLMVERMALAERAGMRAMPATAEVAQTEPLWRQMVERGEMVAIPGRLA